MASFNALSSEHLRDVCVDLPLNIAAYIIAQTKRIVKRVKNFLSLLLSVTPGFSCVEFASDWDWAIVGNQNIM